MNKLPSVTKIISVVIFLFLYILVIVSIKIVQKQQVRQQAASPSKIIWPAFAGGGSRTNINASESIITAANVGSLKLLWQKALPYTTNGSPVEAPDINTSAGNKDLIFITTQKGSLVAIDAATGNKVWQSDTTGNFVQSQGTSSSPIIDPSGQFVYSYGLDGKIHKYTIATGQEVTSGGFPPDFRKVRLF